MFVFVFLRRHRLIKKPFLFHIKPQKHHSIRIVYDLNSHDATEGKGMMGMVTVYSKVSTIKYFHTFIFYIITFFPGKIKNYRKNFFYQN